MNQFYIHTYTRYYCYKIPSLSQMLTTDPGESEECYACKLLEVLIIHCHAQQSDAGGSDRVTGGKGQGHRWVGQNTNGWSNVTVDGWGHWRAE